MKSRPVVIYVLLAFVILSCNSSFEDSIEYDVPGEISIFSVPDSAPSAAIPVHIAGLLGRTTAFSFQGVEYLRTDSLFEFRVHGRRIDRLGEVYTVKDISFDTTLVLSTSPPRVGQHLFRVYGSNGTFQDTCKLY